MGIVNLFFIPMIAVYILYKTKAKELKFSAEFVSVYMIMCSVVAILTKLGLFAVRYLFNFEYLSINSAYYSIAAAFVSLLLPLVLKIISVKRTKE